MISLRDNQRKEKKKIEKNYLIRKPAVSGSFYPAKKEELEHAIDDFLRNTKKIGLKGIPRILIAPHAGIIYSGLTASWGFKQIEGEKYQRVILLGASHTSWFSYVAVDESDFWETPLGKVEVDRDFITLIADEKKIKIDENPFIREHCLEVELIFLQKVLKDFKIIPILVSEIDDNLSNYLAQKIAENFDEKTLLVISSDLSHYPPYELAKKADKKIIEGVLTGKKEEFEKKVKEVESAGFLRLETSACGQKAIGVGLLTADKLQIKNFKLVHYSNSGDFFGDKSGVVGYGAIIGYSPKLAINNKDEVKFLTKKEEELALKVARESLESFFKKRVIPEFQIKEKGLIKPLGCFVTLRKNGVLRGCLGEFEPSDPLWKVIRRVTLKTAFTDFRFPAVTEDELSEIKIEISVMSPKKRITDWRKIKLGKQGVVIEGYGRAGTFLPDVALETNWSLEEFLSHLCQEKAGLPKNCYQDSNVKIYVFEVQKIKEE